MEYYAVVFKGESLSHHGILGMKWGVRRFQNPDGTLTEEGKRRYYLDEYSGKYVKRTKKDQQEYDLERKNVKALEADKKLRQAALDAWKKGASIDEQQQKLGWALYTLAQEKSGGGYIGEPVSPGQKKLFALPTSKKLKLASKYYDRVSIQALKDLGVEVNEENIKAMKGLMFYD